MELKDPPVVGHVLPFPEQQPLIYRIRFLDSVLQARRTAFGMTSAYMKVELYIQDVILNAVKSKDLILSAGAAGYEEDNPELPRLGSALKIHRTPPE